MRWEIPCLALYIFTHLTGGGGGIGGREKGYISRGNTDNGGNLKGLGHEMDWIFCGDACVYLGINYGRGRFLTFLDAPPSGKFFFYILAVNVAPLRYTLL